jgi:hypothetical protein
VSIEFLPGPEPDDLGDEQLEEPERRHRWWTWLVVALVVIGAGVWVVTRPSSAPRQSQASASTRTRTPRADPACRGIPDCAVSSTVPAEIGQLAQEYLPEGVRLHVHSIIAVNSLTHGDLLVRRDIAAFVDSVTVLIRVQRGGPANSVITPDPPGFGSVLLHQTNSGFIVRLQYLAPETVPPMIDQLNALMRDPRLVRSA